MRCATVDHVLILWMTSLLEAHVEASWTTNLSTAEPHLTSGLLHSTSLMWMIVCGYRLRRCQDFKRFVVFGVFVACQSPISDIGLAHSAETVRALVPYFATTTPSSDEPIPSRCIIRWIMAGISMLAPYKSPVGLFPVSPKHVPFIITYIAFLLRYAGQALSFGHSARCSYQPCMIPRLMHGSLTFVMRNAILVVSYPFALHHVQ